VSTRVTLFSINGPGVAITFPEDKQTCITEMQTIFADTAPDFVWDDSAKGLSYLVNKSQIFYVEYRAL
jgi:hypothetical protein